MSQPPIEDRLLDLLYGELEPAEAEALEAEINAHPETAARLAAWRALTAAAAQIPERTPDPQVHYEILRSARNVLAERRERRGFWAWLGLEGGLSLAPALAMLGVAVVAAGSVFLLTRESDSGSAPDGVFESAPAPTQSAPTQPALAAPKSELREPVRPVAQDTGKLAGNGAEGGELTKADRDGLAEDGDYDTSVSDKAAEEKGSGSQIGRGFAGGAGAEGRREDANTQRALLKAKTSGGAPETATVASKRGAADPAIEQEEASVQADQKARAEARGGALDATAERAKEEVAEPEPVATPTAKPSPKKKRPARARSRKAKAKPRPSKAKFSYAAKKEADGRFAPPPPAVAAGDAPEPLADGLDAARDDVAEVRAPQEAPVAAAPVAPPVAPRRAAAPSAKPASPQPAAEPVAEPAPAVSQDTLALDDGRGPGVVRAEAQPEMLDDDEGLNAEGEALGVAAVDTEAPLQKTAQNTRQAAAANAPADRVSGGQAEAAPTTSGVISSARNAIARGQNDEAIAGLSRHAERNPGDAGFAASLFQIAQDYERRGDLSRATQLYKLVVSMGGSMAASAKARLELLRSGGQKE